MNFISLSLTFSQLNANKDRKGKEVKHVLRCRRVMPSAIKAGRDDGVRRVAAIAAADDSQVEGLGAGGAGLVGGLEARFQGPAFEGGVVVFCGEDSDVERVAS